MKTSAVNASPAQRGRAGKHASPWRNGAHCATPRAQLSFLRYVRNETRGGTAVATSDAEVQS